MKKIKNFKHSLWVGGIFILWGMEPRARFCQGVLELSVRSFVFNTHRQLSSHHEPCLLTKTSFWDYEIVLYCMNHERLHHVINVIELRMSRITNQYLTFTRYGFIVYAIWYCMNKCYSSHPTHKSFNQHDCNYFNEMGSIHNFTDILYSLPLPNFTFRKKSHIAIRYLPQSLPDIF